MEGVRRKIKGRREKLQSKGAGLLAIGGDSNREHLTAGKKSWARMNSPPEGASGDWLVPGKAWRWGKRGCRRPADARDFGGAHVVARVSARA